MSDASEPKIAAHATHGPAASLTPRAGARALESAPPAQDWPVAELETAKKDTALYRYLPALDGLRAISILWVLSVHWPRNLPLSELGLVKRGAFGVEIFFAISGFLVTRSLQQCVARAARERGSKGAIFRDFIVRRVARIWPPYFVALFVALAGMLFDPATRGNLAIFQPIAWSFPTFLANYTISRHYTPLSLLVMWSLCFEEQFYVILIALYLIGKKSLSKYIIGLALASIALRIVATTLHPEYFSEFVLQMEPQWRFDAIAWGCIAWIYHARLLEFFRPPARRALVLPILLAMVALCYANPANFMVRSIWYAALAPVLTALVCVLAYAPPFWLSRILAWSPLVLIGSISYEMYLSHITVFRVLTRLGFERLSSLYYPLTYLCSMLVGWAFHRLFSKPAQRLVRRWLDRAPVETASSAG